MCIRLGNGQRTTLGAHRVFLILALGRPIRDKYEAGHHTCHNRLCMRHVEEQTRAYNMLLRNSQRGYEKEDSADF
jgi:hypothetical protein